MRLIWHDNRLAIVMGAGEKDVATTKAKVLKVVVMVCQMMREGAQWRGGGKGVLAHHIDGKVLCSRCPGEIIKVGVHHKLASRVLHTPSNLNPRF